MDIFVYSDESGVFDRAHEDFFIFGGVVFFSKEEKDICARKYLHAERALRKNRDYGAQEELKASRISEKDKGKLFRSLSQYQRFGIIISQQKLLPRIFQSKKDKQRYLDYAYKIGLKRLFQSLIDREIINKDEVTAIHIYADEHTTATNGRYELREGLEQEFKNGTYNYSYSLFFPPIFTNLRHITLEFCNSEKRTLIRAADIVANKLFYLAHNKPEKIGSVKIFVINLP